jgi:hypothetical protein
MATLSSSSSADDRDIAMHTNEVIVRWGLAELSVLLEEAGMKRPFTVASDRWSHLDLAYAGLAAADLRALPLHLVKGDRPFSRRRGVYIIDGSDDPDGR